MAAALIYYERPDIIVHEIEPSPFKCDYIDILRKANRLSNVRIIQAGLSDKAGLFTYAPIVDGLHKSGVVWGSNTVGTTWVPFENVDMPPKLHLTDWKPPTPQNPELSPEVIHFTTLDLLVENGTIPEKNIGYTSRCRRYGTRCSYRGYGCDTKRPAIFINRRKSRRTTT